MATLATGSLTALPHPRTGCAEDHRVFLHDVSWEEYEALLAMRGESSVPRITYLEGELELMSPSVDHERYKKATARLVEIYALERDLSLNGYGSWTIKSRRFKRGAEPDECYVLGAHPPKRPDLAIEVAWTRGGIDKLEIYRKLGVREIWMWEDYRIHVHVLRGERYEEVPASELLPDLDLAAVAVFAMEDDQTKAVREFQARLRGKSGKGRRPAAGKGKRR